MIKLSKRLETIANFVPSNKKVVDVGTDHGFVPNFLYEKGISSEIVASDISKNSLDKSVAFTKLRGNEEGITHIHTSGLKGIHSGEVIIIAGMGGILISRIIQEDFDSCRKATRLILQPMQGSDVLREYLWEHGFTTEDEALVHEDQRYFEIIVAKYTGEKERYTKLDTEISPLLRDKKPKELEGFLKEKIRFRQLIKETMNTESEKAQDRQKELETEIKQYEVILDELFRL